VKAADGSIDLIEIDGIFYLEAQENIRDGVDLLRFLEKAGRYLIFQYSRFDPYCSSQGAVMTPIYSTVLRIIFWKNLTFHKCSIS
jgi:hypothetical protein